MSESQPVAVWDPRSSLWPRFYARGAAEWARQHLGDPMDICRVEFYMTDGQPSAVVHRFKREGGRRHYDPETFEAAEAEPETIALSSLPPDKLLSA